MKAITPLLLQFGKTIKIILDIEISHEALGKWQTIYSKKQIKTVKATMPLFLPISLQILNWISKEVSTEKTNCLGKNFHLLCHCTWNSSQVQLMWNSNFRIKMLKPRPKLVSVFIQTSTRSSQDSEETWQMQSKPINATECVSGKFATEESSSKLLKL